MWGVGVHVWDSLSLIRIFPDCCSTHVTQLFLPSDKKKAARLRCSSGRRQAAGICGTENVKNTHTHTITHTHLHAPTHAVEAAHVHVCMTNATPGDHAGVRRGPQPRRAPPPQRHSCFFPPQFFWRAGRGFIQFTPLIDVISVRLPLTPPSPFPFFPLHTLNHQHSTAVPLTNVPHALGSHPLCEELHFFFDLRAGSPGAWCHTSPGISENTRKIKKEKRKKDCSRIFSA